MNSLSRLLLCAILFYFSSLQAQEHNLWKKRVVRLVDISKVGTVQGKHDEAAGHFLSEIIADIQAGKLTAYYTFDTWFTTALPKESVRDMLFSKKDSIAKADPKSTLEVNKLRDPGAITLYKIIEEWNFNPSTKETDVQIKGIAPAQTMLNSDGSHRSIRSMFWLRYDDVKDLLIKYSKQFPKENVLLAEWNGYVKTFVNDNIKIGPGRPRYESATPAQYSRKLEQIIDLSPDDDGHFGKLIDCSPDTSLLEILIKKIKGGDVNTYLSSGADKIDPAGKQKVLALLTGATDTTYLDDPASGKKGTIMRVFRKDFNYDEFHKYKFSEEWNFDPGTGKSHIKIISAAPLQSIYGDEGDLKAMEEMFWLRFADFNSVLPPYEEYHSQTTIARYTWLNMLPVPEYPR